MRILHVTDNYPPADGGLERSVATIATALAARDHDVSVATLSRADAPARERVDGVDVYRIDGWIKHLRRFAADAGHQYHPTFRDPKLVGQLQRLVEDVQPDVVHVHGWVLYSVLPLRLPAGTALVVGLHDFSLICNNKTLLRNGRVCAGPAPAACVRCASRTYGVAKGVPLAVGLMSHRSGHRRVHRFVANSRYVADVSAAGAGVDRERIAVISPPVDDATSHTDPRRPDFLPPGDFVLFVGAMGPHKGLDVLLDAHARLRTAVPLVILGLPRADSPDCDRPGVTVVHNVPHDDVMASWRAATVGAAPSVCAEAFGLVAVEAMSEGTPMVVTAVGGLQEVIEEGVTGLIVQPGDVGALTVALDRLLGDEQLRIEMGAAGRLRSGQYELSRVMPYLEECYVRARVEAAHRTGVDPLGER